MGGKMIMKNKQKNQRGRITLWQDIKANKMLYLMFLPAFVWFGVFRYYPMAGIIVAFKRFNYRAGIFGSPWNGFDNFAYFVKSGKAWLVTKNTILYNLAFLAVYIIGATLVAILLSEVGNKVFRKLSQTILFLPYFVSWVVLASLVYRVFDYDTGIINMIRGFFSLDPLNISTDPKVWRILLPVLYGFKWIGYGSILFLSAIMGLDRSCYEAAEIDGATVFQRIRYITLPLLRPTSITLILLGVGKIMRGDFDMFYQLIGNNGLLMDSTDIIDTLVFRSLMGNSDFGMASSAAFYQSILCFVIIITVNNLVKKVDEDSALF